jgi:aryl-alcohol dehydrogenase-like predicted oxidoreductase
MTGPGIETTELRPGYRISRLIKGGWQLARGHGQVDYDRVLDEMGDYVRAGITAFDCADIYTGVEDLIGAFRARAIARGEADLIAPLRVHTKCVPDLERLATLSRADVQATIDRSLRRLGVERLDLVQFHWWDTDVPRHVEVAGWLADMRAEGKIELVGTTNFNTDCMAELVAAGVAPASIQVQFSLLDRRPEKRLLALCAGHDIKVLCYGTVAGGFLSDRWLGQPEPHAPYDNRSLAKYKLIIDDRGGWEAFQSLLRALRRVADRHDTDIASVAMRAMLDDPRVAGIIVGVRHGGHLARHAALSRLKLTAADHAEIAAAMAEARPLDGDVYDLERDREGRHGRIMHYNLNRA